MHCCPPAPDIGDQNHPVYWNQNHPVYWRNTYSQTLNSLNSPESTTEDPPHDVEAEKFGIYGHDKYDKDHKFNDAGTGGHDEPGVKAGIGGHDNKHKAHIAEQENEHEASIYKDECYGYEFSKTGIAGCDNDSKFREEPKEPAEHVQI